MIIQKKSVKKTLRQKLESGNDSLPLLFDEGIEYHCLSVGQFNLIDIIEHINNQIGNCNIDLAVWTAADSNLKKAKEFIENGYIDNMRWIIDPSFVSRQPKYVKTLKDLFGYNCVRTIPTHAKFILLYNQNHKIIIQTSMNLNQNKRLESFTIICNSELVQFYIDFVDNVFDKIPASENFKSQNVKVLEQLADDWNTLEF